MSFSVDNLKEIKDKEINKLTRDEVNNIKFIKVMFGTESKAGNGYKYKVNEINETDNWHPETNDAKAIGGFNFSVEEKILRWLVRGDTLYDVIIPDDAEVYDCYSPSTPHGVFSSNKIIIKNPRKLTEDMVFEFYEKSNIPEKSYFKAMAGIAIRGYINVANKIFDDKINKENAELAFSEFKDFLTPRDGNKVFSEELLGDNTKIIYNKFIDFMKVN